MKLSGQVIFILAAIAPAALVSAVHVQPSDLRARYGSFGLARIGVPMRPASHRRRHHARSIAQPAQLAPRAEDDREEDETESRGAAVSIADDEDCEEDDSTAGVDDSEDCEEESTLSSTSSTVTSTSTQTSTSSRTRTTTQSSSSSPPARQSSSTSSSSSAEPTQTGGGGGSSGKATFFFQGAIGACGIGNEPVPDTDKVVALCPAQFRAACGKQIQITNELTGETTTARGNDLCPSCDCSHLDLSLGAWDALGSDRSIGVIDISFQIL